MKSRKAQREIMKQIDRGKSIVSFVVDEKNVFVSLNEYFGVIIPTKKIRVDMDRTINVKNPQVFNIIDQANKMEETGNIKKRTYRGKKKKYIELHRVGHGIYIDSWCKKYFKKPNFYQGESKEGVVVITDCGNEKNDRVVAGLIMPYRMGDEQ